MTVLRTPEHLLPSTAPLPTTTHTPLTPTLGSMLSSEQMCSFPGALYSFLFSHIQEQHKLQITEHSGVSNIGKKQDQILGFVSVILKKDSSSDFLFPLQHGRSLEVVTIY